MRVVAAALALVFGLTPLGGLLVSSSPASSAPLSFLMDTLSALAAGTNPSLMLLLGASLSNTTRKARAQLSDGESLTSAEGLEGVKDIAVAGTLNPTQRSDPAPAVD